MDKKRAITVLQKLRKETQGDTKEAIDLAIKALKAYRPSKVLPSMNGSRWTTEEEQAITEAFEDGDTIREIATRHKRTKKAVLARLQKLGHVDYDYEHVEFLLKQ